MTLAAAQAAAKHRSCLVLSQNADGPCAMGSMLCLPGVLWKLVHTSMMMSNTSFEIRGAGWSFLGLTCSYMSRALQQSHQHMHGEGSNSSGQGIPVQNHGAGLACHQPYKYIASILPRHLRHGEGLQGVLVKVGHRDPCCQLQSRKDAGVRCVLQLLRGSKHQILTSA